jgi:hypothetical protein
MRFPVYYDESPKDFSGFFVGNMATVHYNLRYFGCQDGFRDFSICQRYDYHAFKGGDARCANEAR